MHPNHFLRNVRYSVADRLSCDFTDALHFAKAGSWPIRNASSLSSLIDNGSTTLVTRRNRHTTSLADRDESPRDRISQLRKCDSRWGAEVFTIRGLSLSRVRHICVLLPRSLFRRQLIDVMAAFVTPGGAHACL